MFQNGAKLNKYGRFIYFFSDWASQAHILILLLKVPFKNGYSVPHWFAQHYRHFQFICCQHILACNYKISYTYYLQFTIKRNMPRGCHVAQYCQPEHKNMNYRPQNMQRTKLSQWWKSAGLNSLCIDMSKAGLLFHDLYAL